MCSCPFTWIENKREPFTWIECDLTICWDANWMQTLLKNNSQLESRDYRNLFVKKLAFDQYTKSKKKILFTQLTTKCDVIRNIKAWVVKIFCPAVWNYCVTKILCFVSKNIDNQIKVLLRLLLMESAAKRWLCTVSTDRPFLTPTAS